MRLKKKTNKKSLPYTMVYGSMLKISGQRPWISIFFFNFILKTKKKESIEISNICGMDEQQKKTKIKKIVFRLLVQQI